MTKATPRPLISFGTFMAAVVIFALAWIASERFESLWPFAIAAPLAIAANLIGFFSPGGSVFWVFAEAFGNLRKRLWAK